jgi:hypothetical protein
MENMLKILALGGILTLGDAAIWAQMRVVRAIRMRKNISSSDATSKPAWLPFIGIRVLTLSSIYMLVTVIFLLSSSVLWLILLGSSVIYHLAIEVLQFQRAARMS